MSFEQTLVAIKEDIDKHKNNSDELFVRLIQQRLDKALEAYQYSIINSLNYLRDRESLSLLRRMSKD